MLYKIINKRSNILVVGIALSSMSVVTIKSAEFAETRKNSFDVRDKNIGFSSNPIPGNSACLLDQAIPGETTTIYRNSVVSPTIAVNPNNKKHVVAAWQQGVNSATGAGLDVGIAYSKDGGKHWSHTTVPLQDCTGGITQSVNSASLSFGLDGNVHLVAAVSNISQEPNTLNQSGVVSSMSSDNGKTWSTPRYLAASQDFVTDPDMVFPANVQSSISVDPITGNIIGVWSNLPEAGLDHSNSQVSVSMDGGLTWSTNSVLYNPSNDVALQAISNGLFNNVNVANNMLTTLPNGNLVNFMTRRFANPGVTNDQFVNDVWPYQYSSFDIAAVTSTDNGATWQIDATPIATLDGNATFTGGYTYATDGSITGGVGAPMSTSGSNDFFDVAVNPNNGYLYAAWQTGELTENQLPQIALSTSRDNGATWSDPVRVSTTPLDAANAQAFTPSIAIDENNNVGILYYDLRQDDNTNPNKTKANVFFAQYKETSSPTGSSTGVGLNFVREIRVTKDSYIIQNGPQVDGKFITNGNYTDLAALGDDFYAIYVKSNEGPFMESTVLVNDPATSTMLLRDNNKRTAPFFSRIDA